jgi:CheY-like chemotaxis protein/GAF domain-containing protein
MEDVGTKHKVTPSLPGGGAPVSHPTVHPSVHPSLSEASFHFVPAIPVQPEAARRSPASDAGGSGAVPFPVFSPSAGLAVSLLNAIGEGVAVASRSGEVLWGNDLFARQSGALQERISSACRQFNRDFPMPPGGVAGGIASPTGRSEQVFADGDRFLEVVITPVPAGMTKVAGAGAAAGPGAEAGARGDGLLRADALVVVFRDDTSARRLQQRINSLDQAGSELIRFDAETVRKHNAHERLKLLEEKIIRFSKDLLHFDHFAIRLLDERSGKLERIIGYGLPKEFDAFDIRPALEGHGISGFVAASGRSYVSNDTSSDPLYLPGIEGARSSLTVPLRLQDKVIGIMNVESQSPAAFGEEERQLGEIFARYVAVALHMLDLLVVERSATNQTVSGRVAVELKEPLEDIAHEVDILRSHLERIRRDIESIRARIAECAAGPASLLGVEQAMADKATDPIIEGRRVLIADDEARIRRVIGDVLTLKGAIVTVCEDGSAAIRALEAEPGAFAMILSDIRMPDHNGYEIFAAVQRTSPGAAVILMTGFGYDPHHSIVRASQEGLQCVLFKPFQVERLLDEVRKALTKS